MEPADRMEKTSMMLPRDLKARAAQSARARGVSLGELVRTALDALLAKKERGADPLREPLVWKGPAPKDGSINYRKYLYGQKGRD